MIDTREINEVVTRVMQREVRHRPATVIDVCLIGSVSGHYGWSQTRLVDADLWVLTDDRSDLRALDWVRRVTVQIGEGVARIAPKANYVARAIDGPFKPAPADEDIVFLHLLIDDPESFSRRSSLTRYSWRKYRPLLNPELLSSLSPPRPTFSAVVTERWGLREAVANMGRGVITMPETHLDSGDVVQRDFDRSSFTYAEFCMYSVMMSARNIARVNGFSEPDELPNAAFSRWYSDAFGDEFPESISRLKQLISTGQVDSPLTERTEASIAKWCEHTMNSLGMN